MNKTLPGVYVILNALNHKRYVGSSAGKLNLRWAEHKYMLKNNKHRNPHLQASWNKYGHDAFAFIILENTTSESALEAEKKWYEYFKQQGFELYNIKPGGQNSQLGLKMSEKTRQAIAKSQKGRIKSKEEIEKIRQAHVGKPAPWTSKRMQKTFTVIDPEGHQHSGENLLKFSTERKLDTSGIWKVVKGERPSHKGWTSPEARKAYLAEHPLKRLNNLNQTCPICLKEFHIKPYEAGRRVFCSRACRAKSDHEKYSGDGNPNFKHGRRVKHP